MSELKPCPFCGGDAELHSDYSSESGDWYVIDCLNNGCMRSERSAWDGQQVSTGWRKTESEATEAWNTRYERTCQMTRLMSVGRTDFMCDQCHHCTCYTKPNFCPTCGAKVVEP